MILGYVLLRYYYLILIFATVVFPKKSFLCEYVIWIDLGIGDSKLRDRVRIYRQHIRQSDHEKLKVEKHLRTCVKRNFTIFPFLQLRSNDTDLRREYEDYFIKKYKTKLNSL